MRCCWAFPPDASIKPVEIDTVHYIQRVVLYSLSLPPSLSVYVRERVFLLDFGPKKTLSSGDL